MDKSLVKVSRFLSFILRHKPESISLSLDEAGWADVSALLTKFEEQGCPLSMESLLEIVATDDKGRYAFNADETRIRANQGHSINIDPACPRWNRRRSCFTEQRPDF
jgi:putative RNA 2'-phosphotransferase